MTATQAEAQGELDFLQGLLLGSLVVAVFVAAVVAVFVRSSGPQLITAAARTMFVSSSAANRHLALGVTSSSAVESLRVKLPSSWSKPKADLALLVRCDTGTVTVAIGHLSVSAPCSGHADEAVQLPSAAAGSTVLATVDSRQHSSWGLAVYR